MEVLQPCRLTDQIRLNTAGEKRQQGSKGRGRQGGKEGHRVSRKRGKKKKVKEMRREGKEQRKC